MRMQDRLQALIDSGQDSALARFTLGELLHKDGDADGAIAHLAEAVRLDPQYSAAWKLYGRALLDAGRIERALEVLAHGIDVAETRGDNQAAREMRVFRKRAERARP